MARKRKQSTTGKSGDGRLYLMAFLLLSCVHLMVVASRMAHVPVLRATDLLPLGILGATAFLLWFCFRVSNYKGDRAIPLLTFILSGMGFLIQFRLGMLDGAQALRPSTYAYPLGLAVFLVVWLMFRGGRYALLAGFSGTCWLLANALLVAILLLGERVRGAVFLAGQFNPAELIKPLLAIFLAAVLTHFRKHLQQTVVGMPAPPLRTLIALGAMWLLPMGLLVVQRDLGMIILLNLVLLVLIFMATGRWGYLVTGLLGIVAASYAGFQLFAHARTRFLVWQDPFQDPTGRGWQILQSLSAMFSGGLQGSGVGAGAPRMVPIASSDFVYAVWAEELGFIGCVWLVIMYLLLFYRGFRVADQVRAPFAQTLSAGIVTLLAMQTLMNIGGVTKAIPLTGITLPLISHGGSSLVVTLLLLGLLTALSEPATARRR
jgi:cell division protein FtsW (lipid II flippase)